MDDLYGNAWGDSSDITGDLHLPRTTSWTTPKLPTHHEADLAAPSWSTGTGIGWNEPSEDAHGFNWSGNDPDLAWSADTTFQDIPIRRSNETEAAEVHTDPEVEEEEQTEVGSEAETAELQEDSVSITLGSPIATSPSELETNLKPPPSSLYSRSPSPDGFGTFETGFESSSQAAVESLSPGIADEEAWGSPWVGTERSEETSDSKPVDEWEAARQQKEQLDRMIPPEVLASILAQCTEFFQDSKPSSEQPKEEPSKDEDTADTSWMSQWRNGLDSIEGLETLVQTIVPDLTLQPAPQFTKTAIAKSMASSIRLTKNLPLAKNSPLSLYLATKGSTAWENAVKGRKLVVEEDVVPAGWRILEKPAVAETSDSAKSTKQGGFFSFWGRRHSKTPSTIVDSPTQSISSPLSRPPSIAPTDSEVASRRSSHEITYPSLPSSKENVSSVTPASETKSVSPSIPEETPTAVSSYADAPDLTMDTGDTPPPAQAPPSAVSRFLNRFSRTRSSLGSPSSRSSLALSSDDLDVLSDIVPSAHDGFEDDGDDIPSQSLASVLKAEPLPPVLPPPPIAPPPQPRPSVMNGSTSFGSLGESRSTESVPTSRIVNNDLDDIFGAFEAVSKPSKPSAPSSAGDDFDVFSFPFTEVKESAPAVNPPKQPPSTINSTPSPTLDILSPTIQPRAQQSATNPSTPISRPGSSLSGQAMHHSNASIGNSPSRTLQPKLPLSLSLPPPPSVDPMTPPLSASEVPLAKLYPNAVRKPSIPSVSTSTNVSRSSSPSVANAAPRKRNTTPIMVDKPSKISFAAPLLPPPPAFAAPPLPASNSVAQVQNLFGDDDDDFADFQSPVEPIPATSLSSQPSSDPFSFTLPPPPEPQGILAPTHSATPLASAAFTAPALSSTPPRGVPHNGFGDELSSFFSSSSSTNLHPHSSLSSGFDSSFGSASDVGSFLSTHDGISDFDKFADTPSSSALRTPSPPRPLDKSPKPSLHIKAPPSSSKGRMSDETRTRQHQHTLSLMERAAARPGRWPAPPSPLPQALAFPAPGSATKNVDLMGDDDSFGDFSDSPTVARKNNFLLPPPPHAPSPVPTSTAGASLFGLDADSREVPQLSMPPLQSVKKQESRGSGNGGLSAQDLSFFEGL